MTDKAYNKINEMLDVCRSSIKIQHLALSEIAKGAENASIVAQETIEEIDRRVLSRNKVTERIPVKIRITKCSKLSYWYKDCANREYDVIGVCVTNGSYQVSDKTFVMPQDAIVTEWKND